MYLTYRQRRICRVVLVVWTVEGRNNTHLFLPRALLRRGWTVVAAQAATMKEKKTVVPTKTFSICNHFINQTDRPPVPFFLRQPLTEKEKKAEITTTGKSYQECFVSEFTDSTRGFRVTRAQRKEHKQPGSGTMLMLPKVLGDGGCCMRLR